jgi:predicted DNA-binding protein
MDEPMQRKQLYLTAAQNKRLREVAGRTRRSEAELVREALARYLMDEEHPARSIDDDALWDLVGAGESDEADLSERVDEILYGADHE